MPIDPAILKVQPGDDRVDMDGVSPATTLSFDLNTPDTAPDDWQRAAARRISSAIGVPDPDGRIWRGDRGAFASGSEYLGFIRGLARSGNVWEYAASKEWKDFEAADDAGRLAIASQARGGVEKAAKAVGKTLFPEGYGLPEDSRALADAPEDARAANARLRADREARRRYNLEQTARSEPFAPPRDADTEKADRSAVDAWRQMRDDKRLVDAHRDKLMNGHLWAVWLAVAPSLSDRGRDIAVRAFKDRKLSGSDIADFQRLDEKEQAVVAKLARLSRAPVAGSFWNTLGDAGIGFINGAVQIPVNAVKQADTLTTDIDQAVFGKDAGLVDRGELNRRARTEQRLTEALGDTAGIDPSGAEHGYAARSLVGALSTMPYMWYASMGGGAGFAAVAFDFMQRLDERVAQEGGDVHQDTDYVARKLVWGALYTGIESVSAIPIFKSAGDVALKTMFLKLATRHGTAAAEKLAGKLLERTAVESLEEAVQRVVEDHAASVGLDQGPGWREAFEGGVHEFCETLGTMGIVSAFGLGRQGFQARSPRGRQALADHTTDALRRESFLLDTPLASSFTAEAMLAGYRDAWKSGGAAGLEGRSDLTPEQASFLAHVFDGEAEGEAVERFIAGRNIITAGQGDALSGGVGTLTPGDVRTLLAEAGADGASRLQAVGFTEAGAARVADYFKREAGHKKSLGRAFADIRESAVRDMETPEAQAARVGGAVETAAEIQPLRALYQRAGTREGAAKAFKEIGFTDEQSSAMADAFHNENSLATSPEAAAAFRAFYLDTSEDESAATRLRRMTGFESTTAPEHGEGAARLTLRGADGAALGAVLYRPGRQEAFDPESGHAAEAVEQFTGGAVTAAEWRALTPEHRADAAARMRIRATGGFTLGDEGDPSVRADGSQADILTGRITFAEGAPSSVLYHEAAHAWLAVMRRAGRLTADDIKKLQEHYGPAADNPGWFNEEALAEDIREIGAATDFTPDRALASRFVEAVRRFAGAARQTEARRTAASGTRQALYESIVYGRAFEGVGDFEAAPAAAQAEQAGAADPLAGASAPSQAAAPEAGDSENTATDAVNQKPGTANQKPAASAPSADPRARKPVKWDAATPQGNLRVGGYWMVAPRSRFISDADPRYDFSLQGRTRNITAASSEQIAAIAAEGTFDPLRLMDAPDTAGGAMIVIPVTLKNENGKAETSYMVLSGNGRFRALDQVDADNRGDTYRGPVQAFADERGIPYDPADMTAGARPRLVRVLNRHPAGTTLQQIASLSNQNAVLQMSDAEQAAADAELIGRDNAAGLFSANKDGLPSRNGSDEFFAWFVRSTGDASLTDSKGNPTDTARARARRAMLALAIGQGARGKETVMAFTENAEALGLERQRDSLLMAAGMLSSLDESRPDYGISAEMSRAAAALLQIARERKAGKTVDAASFLAQGDMLEALSAATAEALRLLDSSRPAEGIAEALRRYAELASKIDTSTDDMFGEPAASKESLLAKAIADTELAPGTRYSLDVSLTRERDAAYLAAVERGDIETAQAMVDEAAKAAGYNVVGYHGARSGKKFHIFAGGQHFFSSSAAVARRFAEEGMYVLNIDGNETVISRETMDRMLVEPFEEVSWHLGWNWLEEGGVYADRARSTLIDWFPEVENAQNVSVRLSEAGDFVLKAYMRLGHAGVRDYGGQVWAANDNAPDLLARKYEGFTAKNIREGGVLADPEFPVADTIVLSAPSQIKSADAVTRDDAGNVIPLSQRFNDKNPDIRYSIALAARRYALSVDMPADGEALVGRQLEFLFARQQYDPDYRRKVEQSSARRKATLDARERARVMGVRAATAAALRNPGDPEAWRSAFDAAGDTVSRIIHQFYMPDGPQRFPGTFNGKSLIGLKVATPYDAAALLMPLRNPYQESMKAVFLDDKSRVVGAEVCTVGLLDLAPVHPREIFKRGVMAGATRVVLGHNHPSGDPAPSNADRDITDRLTEAGRLLGIEYVDHIITNGESFYSFQTGLQPYIAEMPDWEAMPGRDSKYIADKIGAAEIATVLRQSSAGHIHAVMLDTKLRITAVTRIPFDPADIGGAGAAISRAVFRAAVSNPTASLLLDLTADGIDAAAANALYAAVSEQGKVIGIKALDAVYGEGGYAVTVNDTATPKTRILPLTPAAARAAEAAPRYSLDVSGPGAFGWMRDYYDESWGDEQAGGARDTRERLAREYAAVVAEHTHPNGRRKETWKRAPNGEPTRLTERQWVLTRTPSFKAWFGDWEKDPANASKVVDENGEPMVVYHGTDSAGFAEFRMPRDTRHGTGEILGHYFSRRPFTAATYSGTLKTVEAPGEPVYDGNGHPADIYAGIYPAFLNIRNPQVSDFGGAQWNLLPEGDKWVVGTAYATGGFMPTYNESGARAVFDDEKAAQEFQAWARKTRDKENLVVRRTNIDTRGLTSRAITYGHDGAMFKNVIDSGGFDVFDENLAMLDQHAAADPDDVFVIFGNNQVKSANANTGAYSAATDDIRYSLQTRVLSPSDLPESMAEVHTGTTIAALAQTKFKDERARHKGLRDAEDWGRAEAYARELLAQDPTAFLGQYLLAKYHGDAPSAIAVVRRLAKPEVAERIKALLGEPGLFAATVTYPVSQRESDRVNMLPYAYAQWLSERLGIKVSEGLVKLDESGAPNTGAKGKDRAQREYAFEGGDDIGNGSTFILVDDVWTSGQTLWTAYEHIKTAHPDARAAAFTALAASSSGRRIKPGKNQLTAFLGKANLTPDQFKEITGNDVGKLTGSELQWYILRGARGPGGVAALYGLANRPGEGSGEGSLPPGGNGAGPRRTGPLGESPRPVRYALDITGGAYSREHLLTGFMAHAVLTGSSFPSRNTVARLAQNIGVESFDYEALSAAARRLAGETEDKAILKAAASRDPDKAAYAVGELARAYERSLVRAGAREGERLASSADRIKGLTEGGVRRAMAAVTGADYADIETDTDVDIAASILAADPKKFKPADEPTQQPAAPAPGSDPAADPAQADGADADTGGETDEEAPGLTDKQRADIARRRREREDRVQGYLDAARDRAAKSRFRDTERKRRAAANAVTDAEEAAATGGAGGSAESAAAAQAEAQAETETSAVPVDFSDRWEAAAFLRVWAFDRFRRDNPNRLAKDGNPAKDKVAVEFYRKTAVRELRELARKLLEPGAPRESVVALIGDITSGLYANQIERRTALVFGLINRHAVREERRSLVKKFRAELKRQFVKGAAFEELGVDLGRVITGAAEEDARYVMRVCELSDRALDGEISALQRERALLNAVLAERENLTAEDGTPLPAGADDMQTRRALRQLALLDKYGGMVDMMPGEILDLSGAGLAGFAQEAVAMRQRWETYDRIVKSIRDPLAAAIARGVEDPSAPDTALSRAADSLTSMLRQRLDFLTRYEADPAKREAARTAISDMMDLLGRGNTDYTNAIADDRAALMRALGQIFTTASGGLDRRRIRAYLRRLDAPIPRDLAAQLTRQGHQQDMTYGQMLQLLASLDQWASYRDNIVRHGRQGQAALIRSFAFEDPKTGEVRRALTSEDTQFLEWLRRRHYGDKRGAITAVTERLAGRAVDSPDPLYHPVKMQQQRTAAIQDASGGAWQPLAGVFSRRVRNTLDFDERASILDMFHSRSHETALLTSFSERGLILREVLTSRQFQDAVRRFHGERVLSRILRQAAQALNGGRPRGQGQSASAALAQRVTSYIGIGFNINSASKQTVSLPVFAARIGFKRLGQILFSPIDREAVRRLRESDEHRARYGTGPASGMNAADRAAYDAPDASAFKKFFGDWGMWPMRKADWLISAWVGQGVYRDLNAKYLDQGMSEADADRRAISETFSLVEETQQSGRAENLPEMSREHGFLGRLVVQFATSPLQQMQYEVKEFAEWRDLANSDGPEANIREARNKFMRALFINHVIVPGLMVAITGLYKSATGGEPDWEKEGFHWTLLIDALMGQFGRIFFAGALAEQTLRVLFLRQPPRLGQLVPAEGVIRFAGNLAYPVRDIVTWDEKHFRADIMRALKSIAVTRLPVSIYENYIADD